MKTRNHDGWRQIAASKRSVLTEETGHRPNLRNSYVTSPLRNAAPSHAPCDGRMTGTGRSPGSRIVAVVRLPKPGLQALLSGVMDNDSPLTVAGAASDWPCKLHLDEAARRHRIPYSPACAGTCAVVAINRRGVALSMTQCPRNPMRCLRSWTSSECVANW